MTNQEWLSIPEAGVYVPQENIVNLSSSATSVEVFNQTGSPFVKGETQYKCVHQVDQVIIFFSVVI